PLRIGGRTVDIPLGVLAGTNNIRFDDWQWSARVDHRFNDKHSLGGRYLFDDRINSGDGQATPPGLSEVAASRPQSASAFLNSMLWPPVFHELRLSYQRTADNLVGANPAAALIPTIEVPELGLTGNTSSRTRTGIGLATTLPQMNFANNYQLQDTWSVLRGAHSVKFGLDFRRQDVSTFFPLINRGRLLYPSLQDLVDDVAQVAVIASPLAGGDLFQHYRYNDYSFFLQDQWRVHPSFAITYGIRYESPGNPFDSLRETNRRIVAAAGGDPRFSAGVLPPRDNNNWAPRFGFNYRVRKGPGLLSRLTGDGKLVARGGYSRTYDVVAVNIPRVVATAFPFVRSDQLRARTPNSLEALRTVAAAPLAGDPNQQVRNPVTPDLRSSFAEQFAFQLQRELKNDWALSVGYVATKGTALIEVTDGNPTVPGAGGRRVDPSRGRIDLRCNCGSSIFHSLQTSLEKRLSRNFSMAAHYTWSTFIDETSDTVGPSISANGDVGLVTQDSFNRRADRSRSSFDRPHRFVANGVFELPFRRVQEGFAGKILGGWQFSGFLTFQSGAPFAALTGSDPGNRLGGIATTVRANVNTSLHLAGMSVEQILRAGGARLFSRATAANPLGNLGRNILRSDGIGNLDLGLFKNTRLRESLVLQLRAELYNTTNSRNFGIPEGRVNSPNFLNQWGLDGGNRRIVAAIRLAF
ncbi:MAG: TonB-dependent receptor domain-containing protein, partial [Bryobacteraceae bacterium]